MSADDAGVALADQLRRQSLYKTSGTFIFVGGCLIVLSIIGLAWGVMFDVSVATDNPVRDIADRIVNIGLVNKQEMILTIACTGLIIGTITYATGKIMDLLCDLFVGPST